MRSAGPVSPAFPARISLYRRSERGTHCLLLTDAQILFAHVGLFLNVETVQNGFAAVEGEDEVARAAVVGEALVFFARAGWGCGVAVPVAEELEFLGAQLFDGDELFLRGEGEMFFAVIGVRQEEDFLHEFLAGRFVDAAANQAAVLDGCSLSRVAHHGEVIRQFQMNDHALPPQ